MNVVISQPTEKQLKVLDHHQYETPDHLSPATAAPSPFDQFKLWFKEAVCGDKVNEPEAVSLSTATASGVPSARMVLFKQLDERGFVFFTNYTSRKSRELEENPWAAMVFYWREVHRSIRILGKVEKVSAEQSHEYFRSRPIGSQLGAWASRQSSVVSEGEVNARLKELEKEFSAPEKDPSVQVPLPDFWGGWRIVPTEIEFWSGKPSRLHDRIRYLRIVSSPDDNPQWKVDRLAP